MKHQLTEELQPDGKQSDEQKVVDDEEEEEDELDVTIEGVEEDEEEEEISELWDAWDGELSLSQPDIQTGDDQRKKSLQLRSSSSQVGGAPGPDSAGTTAVCKTQSVFFIPVCPPGRPGQRAARRPAAENSSSAAEERRAAGEADGV